MSKIILSAILLAASLEAFAQNTFPTPSGNVGIGTTTPTYTLQVQKSSAQPAVMIGGGNAGSPRLQIYGLDADAQAFMGFGADMGSGPYEHSIYFPTGPSNARGKLTVGDYNGSVFNTRLVVLQNGNVGIGVVSPTSRLQVEGAFQSSNFRAANDGFFVGSVGNAASTGTFNTVLGNYAGANITSGGTNTIIGSGIANNLTTGYRNVIIGTLSGGYNLRTGQSITTGGDNIMIGAAAGGNLTTGIQNTYVGMGAGATSPAGMQNVALGKDAGLSADGNYNTLIGAAAGQIIHGNNNTFVGNKTAQNPVYGNSLTFIGANVGISAPDNLTNATGLGYNTQVTTSNTLILGNGANVGIGTSAPDAKLAVKGTVHASEVKVDLNVPGPDYVFNTDYRLRTLESVASYIRSNHHLPEIPSAVEMENNGINLSEMNLKLLQKIEELTLYLIQKDEAEKSINERLVSQQKNIQQKDLQLRQIIKLLKSQQTQLNKLSKNKKAK